MLRLLFIFFIPLSLYSQDSKLELTGMELAFYKFNKFGSRIKNKADVFLYCKVNKHGEVILQYDESNKSEIYKYKLPDYIISNVNRFFKIKKSLKKCYEQGMPEEGAVYGGPEYRYVKLIYNDNKQESACYLEEFMTEEFNNTLLSITGIYADKTPVTGIKDIISEVLRDEITAMHKKTKALASTDGPPPMEE